MTECNAIIEANKEIDRLKRENEKLNTLCVRYGFEMGKLEEENEQLNQQVEGIQYLIDNKIDEFKNGDYGDLPCNTIHMFLDLKEEVGDYSDRK